MPINFLFHFMLDLYPNRGKSPWFVKILTKYQLAHRLSFVEMIVPYGDQNDPHYRKNAFDAGEDNLGKNAHSLKKVWIPLSTKCLLNLTFASYFFFNWKKSCPLSSLSFLRLCNSPSLTTSLFSNKHSLDFSWLSDSFKWIF